MAFTLVTTVGGKASNSFVTVEEADDYLAVSPYPLTAWNLLTESAKAYRLILAAKYMTSDLTWKGWKLHHGQALAFPRYWQDYQDNVSDRGVIGPWTYSPGDLFPSRWELLELLEEETDLWWTEERIAQYDVIPDDMKMAQAFIAYDMVHRMLKGVTDPDQGPSGGPEIKSLSLFGKMSVTTADKSAVWTDNTAFERTIRSEHGHIYLLIKEWLSQISMGPAQLRWPPLLPEVA